MNSSTNTCSKYIRMGFDRLSETVEQLMIGEHVPVDIYGFANDLVTFRNRDDVLTLLIHLGYLTYDQVAQTVHIPNEEIRQEFDRSFRGIERTETIRRLRESEQLIDDTVNGRADRVASQIEKVHREETAPLHYNNEQALRSVIKLAYFSYRDHYIQLEELPGGTGYADIVYLPRRGTALSYPALVIELKWADDAEGAIRQIREKRYPEVLKGYDGTVLLVGISYNRDGKEPERKHKVVIEEYRM